MPKKILVADDSPAIRSLAESLLRQKGYYVLCTSNGTEAWELIRITKPDLVFLDHSLPDLDGEKICEKIKKQSDLKDIPVVVLLGTNEIREQSKYKDLGADGFVQKPFTPEEFLNTVKHFSEMKLSSVENSSEKKEEKKRQDHGYDWFISEMKKEMKDALHEKEPTQKIAPDQDLDKKAISQEKGEEFKAKELNSQKKGYDNFFLKKDEEKGDYTTPGVAYTELNFEDASGQKKSEQKSCSIDVTLSDLDYEEITDKLVDQISTKIAEKIAQMIDKKALEEGIKDRLKEPLGK